MRVIIQRVVEAAVSVDKQIVGEIGKGLLILVGVSPEDTEDDILWLINKVINMRIFNDENDKMNVSILDVKGELLIVSQFTLFASTKKGNRPSFIGSASPEKATVLYEKFVDVCKSRLATKVATGVFGADMKVSSINDGPVTISLDSHNKE